MPLKTYLPDGDIDLTVLGGQINEERMARDICNILEGEERRGTRSLVRGVQYIPAQVVFLSSSNLILFVKFPLLICFIKD